METKEKNEFMGLVEMNESQKKEVRGGSIFILQDIFTPCCGYVINVDPENPFPFNPFPPFY